MELKKLYLKGKQKFKDKHFDSPEIEARTLLSTILNIDPLKIHSEPGKDVDDIECKKYMNAIERRVCGEPLAYITKFKEFFSRDFLVNPNVLIPRPETELLVEEAIKVIKTSKEPKILDLGTGSGCIAITLNCETKVKELYASDVSYSALLTAKKNSALNIGRTNINFINSNLLDCFKSASFNIIISNPPYISEQDFINLEKDIQEFEPKSSLVSSQGGLYHIKRIVEDSKRLLHIGGWCVLEIGFNQSSEVTKIFKENKYSCIEIVKDLNGIERVVKAQWKK